MTMSEIALYTDGSIKNHRESMNAAIGGIGFHFLDKQGQVIEVSAGPFSKAQSSNVMETLAIVQGLLAVFEEHGPSKVRVITDSKIAIGWIQTVKQGGTIVDKSYLTPSVKNALERHENVVFEHVKGHSGNTGNERADQLATNGKNSIEDSVSLFQFLGTSEQVTEHVLAPIEFPSVIEALEIWKIKKGQFAISQGLMNIKLLRMKGKYPEHISTIEFKKDGSFNIDGGDSILKIPPDISKRIKSDFKTYKLPVPRKFSSNPRRLVELINLPEHIKEAVRRGDVYAYGGKYANSDDRQKNWMTYDCLEVRWLKDDGSKKILIYSYFTDGVWRAIEPENFNRLYGVEEAKRKNYAKTLFIHEGAKATHICSEKIESGEFPSDFQRFFKNSAHVGYFGGAFMTHAVAWHEVLNLAEELKAEKIVFVPDNDDEAYDSLSSVSRHLIHDRLEMFYLNTRGWGVPKKWDFGDELPDNLVDPDGEWNTIEPEKMLKWYTFATRQFEDDAGQVRTTFNKAALKHVLYVKSLKKFVLKSERTSFLSREELNMRLAPLSHSQRLTADLLLKNIKIQVDGMTMKPGDERFIVTKGNKEYLNIWENPLPLPLKGDVTPFAEAIKFTFPDITKREYYMRWKASQIINMDQRIMFAAVIIGGMGCGKSSICSFMNNLESPYSVDVRINELINDDFNEQYANKRQMICQEVFEKKRRTPYDMIKNLIADPVISIHQKRMDKREEDNYIQATLLSNSEVCLVIPEGCRRLMVLLANGGIMPEDIKVKLFNWMSSYRSRRSIVYSLLYEWQDESIEEVLGCRKRDLFHPKDNPPMTTEKQKMIEGALEGWQQELAEVASCIESYEICDIKDIRRVLVQHSKNSRYVPADIEKDLIEKFRMVKASKRVGIKNEKIWFYSRDPEVVENIVMLGYSKMKKANKKELGIVVDYKTLLMRVVNKYPSRYELMKDPETRPM